jgi:signal transduction histidine kinase
MLWITSLTDLARRRLTVRFLIYAIPLIFLVEVFTGAVLLVSSYKHSEKLILQDYENIIKGSKGEIGLYMQGARDGLASLALVVNATKLDDWQVQMALTAFNHVHPEFLSLSIITREGEEVLSTGIVSGREQLERGAIIDDAFGGKVAVSPVMLTKESVPYVQIATPVERLGEIQSVLAGELNLKSVWDVLQSIHIGDTGEIFITDLEGKIIGHRTIELVINPPDKPPMGPKILNELKASMEPMNWTVDEDGASYFCMGLMIPQLNWILVLRQARGEIYAHVYNGIIFGVISIATICVLAALLIRWGGNRFLEPIHALHQQVQEIGKGDFEQRACVVTQDEIGDLCNHFNKMAASLKKHIDDAVANAKEMAQLNSLALVGVTFAKVAHEVGNLLSNIKGAIKELQKESLSERGQAALDMLDRESSRVHRFVKESLQYCKPIDLNLQRATPLLPISEAIRSHAAAAGSKGVELRLEWQEGLPAVSMDIGQIYSVVNNLIANSLDAMTEPGKITVRGKLNGEFLLVEVEDDGPGIDPEKQQDIFKPFFTTKGKKGHGLGLAICRSIMEAHRGTIELSSEPGRGAVFTLKFPLE